MNMNSVNGRGKLAYLSLVLACLLTALLGCRQDDPVRQFQVEKSRSGLSTLKPVEQGGGTRAASSAAGSTLSSGAKRMVVAIALKENATWFFKVMAPAAMVGSGQEQLRSFFEKISFDESGNPKFDLPEGWTETPSQSMMRFSTVKFSAQGGPLEIAVSSLAPNQDLLSNVNRWRGQLQLPPVTKETMKLEKVESDGGQLLIYDDTAGDSSPSQSSPPPVSQARNIQLNYNMPDGWSKGRESQIVKVRLLKQVEDEKVQISITELPASMNKWQPNVDRWLGELGMTIEDKKAFLAENATELKVDGAEAQRVRLISEDEKIERATIAIMAIRDDSAWFIKMSGPRELVADSEKEFDEFVESFKFE